MLNNGPSVFTYENKSDAVLKLNHLLHRRWIKVQEIPSKENNVDINSTCQHVRNLLQNFIKRCKSSICWNFGSFINQNLVTK